MSVLVGTLTVFFGTWLGTCFSFFLGRYVLRDLTLRLNGRFVMMRALDRAMKEREGFRFCFLLRLCPLTPFNAFNYIMGGTSISFWSYVLAGPGYIPICIANVFIGTTISSIAALVEGDYDGGDASIITLIVGLVISLLLIIYITIVVRRHLRRMAQKVANEENSTTSHTAAIVVV